MTRAASSARGRLGTALDEFRAGFIEDLSALSLGICLAVAAMVACLTLWMFSPAGMVGRLGDYVPRSPADADAFATVEALRMAAGNRGTPELVFLGSSTVAQITGNGKALEKALAGAPGGPWRVRILTTPLQSPFDQMRLIETALAGRDAQSPPMVVVIGAGLSRLGWTSERLIEDAKGSRIPLASAWVEEELARLGAPPPPPPLPVWAIEHRNFVLLNGMKSLTRLALHRPAPRRVDAFDREIRTDIGRDTILSNIETGMAGEAEFIALQARLVRRILEVPNTHVVFIDEPLSPEIVAVGGLEDELSRFQADIAAMAAAEGAAFWPVVRDAGLDLSHFADDLHIHRGEAQALCRNRLSEKMMALAETLQASP